MTVKSLLFSNQSQRIGDVITVKPIGGFPIIFGQITTLLYYFLSIRFSFLFFFPLLPFVSELPCLFFVFLLSSKSTFV